MGINLYHVLYAQTKKVTSRHEQRGFVVHAKEMWQYGQFITD
jgi:hypothetical protein